VLVAITYGFSVRYLLSTGVLDELAAVCTPVVALGWDDPDLTEELVSRGIEVARLPDAELDHGYRMFRRRMSIVHHSRLRTPSAAIERRQRLASMPSRRDRALTGARQLKDRAELALSGRARALEESEQHALRVGTNLDRFASFLADCAVDAVVSVTPYHDQDALLLAAARALGVASLTSVISFDNPTTRERMLVRSERVLVWNRFNRDELLRSYPDLTPDRIGIIGAPQFDLHRRADLIAPEEDWRRDLGLPPDRPILLYGGGPSFLVPNETRLVEMIDSAIDRGAITGDPFLLVRRHPAEAPEPWRALGGRLRQGVVVEPWAPGSNPQRGWPSTADLVVQMSSLSHSCVHVNVCSSMTLDGAVFDRPQIGPRFVPGNDRAQQRTVRSLYEREHWWPITASGGLRTADDEASLVAAVNDALRDPGAGAEGRARMVENLLTFTDGRSGSRLVGEIREFVSRDRGRVATGDQ